VTSDGQTLLIDCGTDEGARSCLIPALRREGLAPDWLVLSHADYDHFGGAAAIRQAFPHVRTICHQSDRAHIEDPARLVAERYEEPGRYGIPIDRAAGAAIVAQTTPVPVAITLQSEGRLRLEGGRTVDLLHSPGHTPGHLTVWDPATRTAIIGDAVLLDAVPDASGRPAFAPTYRDVDAYRSTIRRLGQLEPSRLLCGHFAPREEEAARSFFDDSDRFTDALERLLISSLDERHEPATLSDLVHDVAAAQGTWPASAASSAAIPVLGHLERLVELGMVRRTVGAPTPGFMLQRSRLFA
jgi:glyoxylase-like metal-dependent hydrolase (beta-lactamase superfamily II)